METHLPTEVELAYEVMPCNAMRTAQEPSGPPHPCSYFRKWGTYHSYDYTEEGPPPEPGIVHDTRYVGRAPLVPELLSGCRKAPLMAVGINPNLPGWWRGKRRSLSPLFDDYRQYAHYFRYRAEFKLEISEADYETYGGGPHDTPFSNFELDVPETEGGDRIISVRAQRQSMYEAYNALLVSLAQRMDWPPERLSVGEDLTYGNMVASPSAKWTTRPDPDDPELPPMTRAERDGIVTECFRERRYFLRQLFQSLPPVLIVFSQSTANAFIGELGSRLVVGHPGPGEPLEQLMRREIRLRYGALPDGTTLDARVLFSPHITGDPEDFGAARERLLEQLVEEARAGGIAFNPKTGHLARGVGGCVFCPMLQIGPCDYAEEIRSLQVEPTPTAVFPGAQLDEKRTQRQLMAGIVESAPVVADAWAGSDQQRTDAQQ